MNPNQEILFAELNKARYGDSRRYQNLFLPKYLEEKSRDYRLRGEEQKRANDILIKWAELEISGKLQKKKETALEGEFITEVFGEALGYVLFSKNAEIWNIESKYQVDGGEADAAIGIFEHNKKNAPLAVIELKGPNANLDKDRFNGRTAVQQCWEYLNAIPECPWGIVSNYVSFRLYHRDNTPRRYQRFVLQDLRKEEIFHQFYYLLEKGGLVPALPSAKSRAIALLAETGERQQKVGEELYQNYRRNRLEMIHFLKKPPYSKPLDSAIRIAQKLLDRIIFIAFCEDRGLLPEKSIKKAYEIIPPFARVTNPKWRNFLNLFQSIDKGNKLSKITPFNGGLFEEDSEIDKLDLEDKWTDFFDTIGGYDFRDEINVDVLGHLFERSVNEIERIHLGGLLDAQFEGGEPPKMIKSAERKRQGIYYTPPEFTSFITHNTIYNLINERLSEIARDMGIDAEGDESKKPNLKYAEYWKKCLVVLQDMKIVDPACGSGAFLISAYDVLEERYQHVIDQILFHSDTDGDELTPEIPNLILQNNIYGVDLSKEAVEISQLALWLRTAQKGKTLADLSKNIICGNSLVEDKGVHPDAIEWEKAFPEVFNRENRGFDCVIGNPPWERMKLQSREFFAFTAPEIIDAVNPADSRKLIEDLEKKNPELYTRYQHAKDTADNMLQYVRECGKYQLTGMGDVNTYAVFAELALNIVSPNGRVGLLVPSGIATDHTTKEFFGNLTNSGRLIALYDFENKSGFFPEVHRSFKFSILHFGGIQTKTSRIDFFFFAHNMDDLRQQNRHIALSPADFKLLNPNTGTCPIFRSPRDANLTIFIYRHVPVLIDYGRKKGGNTWEIIFLRMFDQANDAHLYCDVKKLHKAEFKLSGNIWKKGKRRFIPAYEAKMFNAYDHRASTVIIDAENWVRKAQTEATDLVCHQNPEFVVLPRWWVDTEEVAKVMGKEAPPALMAFRKVTSPTNTRTMIAAFIPPVGLVDSGQIILFPKSISPTLQCCLLANLNSYPLDYVTRQKIANINLNYFVVEQLPIFPPDRYEDRCPWDKGQTLEKWISDRVLKLTCTSNDMIPLAKAAGFDPPVHKWKPDERADLLTQLDAAYFILYGIERDDVEYILSTFRGLQEKDKGMFEGGGTIQRILKQYDHFKTIISGK